MLNLFIFVGRTDNISFKEVSTKEFYDAMVSRESYELEMGG
jgi:hypothetical protein